MKLLILFFLCQVVSTCLVRVIKFALDNQLGGGSYLENKSVSIKSYCWMFTVLSGTFIKLVCCFKILFMYSLTQIKNF